MKRARSLFVGATLAAAFGIAAADAPAAEIALDRRQSGYEQMSRETQRMQDDGAANPGMLWVLDGEVLWNLNTGTAAKACADCHGAAEASMKGVAARYPAFDAELAGPVDLAQRINLCRTRHQQATPLPYESRDLLALAAYVARQSRGQPIADPETDERLHASIGDGRAIFNRRQGQLNLGCAQCHDDNWEKALAGNPVTQGQATGYPIYRLEWQTLGSLQRRVRNCMIGIRAEPYAYGAAELVALEVFLRWRARGLPLEAPAIRP